MSDVYQVQTVSEIDETTAPNDTDAILLGLELGKKFGKTGITNLLRAFSIPRVKRITATVGDLTANTNKEVTVSTELDSSYNLLAVSATPKGGIPFMVAVNNISITSLNLAVRSAVAATGRTVDVVILYN